MSRWQTRILVGFTVVAGVALAWPYAPSIAAPDQSARQAWTTSKVVGTPEPPHAYRIAPAFPKLKFNNPLHLTSAPGTNRFFLLEQSGKIFSFENKADIEKPDLVIDVSKDLTSWKVGGMIQSFDAVYGMTFHPKFVENRYCYVSYVLKGKGAELKDGTRISRFTMTKTDPPKIDPASEKILLTFLAGGHNGACLVFGKDGYLYISSGDAASPNPPDPLQTGQDCSDLLSSVLRIDVDHEDKGLAYSIPKDNPFIGLPKVRPEIWSFGFRNPWKMTFDRISGDLWLGDVGWELWEMVYRIKKGGNYGWSIKEGPQSIKPEAAIGPTPILPPQIAFPHSEAASITGGYVYRGKKYPELYGAYICGDWMSRKIWATRFDGDTQTSHQEIAAGTQQIVSFAEDTDGELYIVDYGPNGGIYSLVPNEEAKKPRTTPFPTLLSETGLFADVAKHEPAPGVYTYAINAEPWADFATSERMVAVPGTGSATLYHNAQPVPDTAWFKARTMLPKDGVLVKTLALEMERGKPETRKRIETQLFHYNGREWRGYTYRWNDSQTDASLVPALGENVELTVKDAEAPGGIRKQEWHFASRTECRQCHNPWAGEALAFGEMQLRSDPKDKSNDSYAKLLALGVIARGKETLNPQEKAGLPSLVDPFGSADLTKRRDSYLHVNCAHCHVFGAGGSVNVEMQFERSVKEMLAVDVKPVQGTFDIPDCRILAAGDPHRSVLYYRMSKQGRGRMPHIGSELVDTQGTALIGKWIRSLPGKPQVNHDVLSALEVCCQEQPKSDRAEAVQKLLTTPAGTLMLLEAYDAKKLPETVRTQVLVAASSKEAPIRDLFERFVPDSQKVKRLGTVIRPEALLSMRGDAVKGKEVFLNKTLNCVTCHKVAGQGGEIGPELSLIAKKLTKRQILESILDPSKDIDAKFAAYSVEVADGRQITGLMISKDDKNVVIRDAQGKDAKIPLGDVSAFVPSKKSLMPDQLLRDLTADQAADLLAFLESLK